MTKQEIKDLLMQIKIFFPRFEGVDKAPGGLQINGAVIDSWWNRLGYMEYERAITILNRYMESENGTKTPGISLWLNGGKAQERAAGYESARLDRKLGMILWTPEPDGKTFEIPVHWSSSYGCWEDNDGRLWAAPEGA